MQEVNAILLKKKPAENTPVTLDCFQLVKQTLPERTITAADEPFLHAEVLFISVDPYMRCQFNDDTGVHYVKPFVEGQPLYSSAVLRVKDFSSGELPLRDEDKWNACLTPGAVFSANMCVPWQDEILIDGQGPLEAFLANAVPPLPAGMLEANKYSATLGDLGITGLTGYFGVAAHEGGVGEGDVLVISTAAGGTGCAACQIAKSRGAKVIGITSSQSKMDYLSKDLGIDGVVSYTEAFKGKDTAEARITALKDALLRVLGDGVSATHYFDNTGGEISEAVFQVLKPEGKIILCGQSSTYNEASGLPYPPPLSSSAQKVFDERKLHRERYLVLQHEASFSTAIGSIAEMMMSGRYKITETRRGPGLGAVPAAFVGMMAGENLGKMVVQIPENI